MINKQLIDEPLIICLEVNIPFLFQKSINTGNLADCYNLNDLGNYDMEEYGCFI